MSMAPTRRARCLVAATFAVIFITLAAPNDAAAFCGFYVSGADASLYNNATMVSLMRHGKRTVLSMQNNYEGPPKDFAMVVPVPVVLDKKQVKTLSDDVFARLDRLTAPRMVEYWERDPCQQEHKRKKFYDFSDESIGSNLTKPDGASLQGRVEVHAQFKVGEYDIVVLSSTESSALERWLNQNDYNIPEGAAPYFTPYIQNGQYFFVAKVDVAKVKFDDGEAVLSPLRFHYDTDDFVLPVRLGLINSKGVQDLIAFILAKDQRYEVANYPNVTIPTNVVVNTEAKEGFGGFYNELFDTVLKENPRSVVTEYSWATSTCDPCPGPPLRPQDLHSLGADVIPGTANDLVVTRLHARYNKHTLGKDLVFKTAPPIVGGGGMPRGAEGAFQQKTAQPGKRNNFQGRYILLHPWQGELDCPAPLRGRWGRPPSGQAPAQSADGVAFDKPTSSLALASYVEEENVAGLKFPTETYAQPVGDVLSRPDQAAPDDVDETAGANAERRPRGDSPGGCAGPANSKTASASIVVVLLALGGLWRRRNRIG
jgi:hypothetical protein